MKMYCRLISVGVILAYVSNGEGGLCGDNLWSETVLCSLSSCHAFRNEFKQETTAKAGKDLFVGKRYTQRGPEQASQNRTECPEPVAQMAETKPSDSIFGSVQDVYPWAGAPLGKEQVIPSFMSQKMYL